jgi:hypothetical protein
MTTLICCACNRRHAANMDKFGAGLTDYLSPAIRANAAKNEGPEPG